MSNWEILPYSLSIFKTSIVDFWVYIKKAIKREKYRKKDIYMWDTSEVSDDSIIGSYTYIGNNSFINKAKIGRYCSIANNVSIGPSEHPRSSISTWVSHIDTSDLLFEKECVIGNDVWIGVNSVIRRGVTVGNSAIIGANSFVNTDIPEFSIAAGSPAKIIKYRLSPKTIELVKSSRWWDYDVKEAQKIIADLQNRIQNDSSPD
jgi:acetyltransferase-like isoleucine patch superfamily enzyme